MILICNLTKSDLKQLYALSVASMIVADGCPECKLNVLHTKQMMTHPIATSCSLGKSMNRVARVILDNVEKQEPKSE
jgi:hypothetical protein